MMHTLKLVGRGTRFRTIAAVSALVILFGACNNADNLATDPSDLPAALADFDTVGTDSLADSLAADSLAADSLAAADSLGVDSTPALEASLLVAESSRRGVPFGPFSLWSGYDRVKSNRASFTASINYTDARGIARQINAARAKGHKLMLMMTDEGRKGYLTRGKFDLNKWKRSMDRYRSSTIKDAVRRGVADGTVIGNSVIDEPKHRTWGGNLNKGVVDQMCRYVKRMFPTLPVGVATVHWWLPSQRFRVCDFIIDQYDYSQPPNGWGTPGGGRGDVESWRKQALAQARKDGIAIAFSMNLLDGGPELSRCPLSKTGGRGTYSRHCRMTPDQVRRFGKALAPSGCAMFMWRFDQKFMAKEANTRAVRDVAAAIASSPRRSCRRSS
jgi:hypothetical protein